MVAKLKKRNNEYYCSNCRIVQRHLQYYCIFCGYEFSNYEEIIFRSELDELINTSNSI